MKQLITKGTLRPVLGALFANITVQSLIPSRLLVPAKWLTELSPQTLIVLAFGCVPLGCKLPVKTHENGEGRGKMVKNAPCLDHSPTDHSPGQVRAQNGNSTYTSKESRGQDV